MISLLGVLVLLALAFALSVQRSAIAWRTVIGALALQAGVGALVLYVPWGRTALAAIADFVRGVLGYSQEGIDFMFGAATGESLGFIFALNVLPVIVFFAALVSVLYHIGVMGWVVRAIGGVLQRVLGTSRPESLSAAANIFVGQAEAPLTVRPFLSGMTPSELFAIMVGGLASIAGSVMAGYAAIGIELEYLLAASFMAAPGGLLMAKIVVPETGQPRNELSEVEAADLRGVNIFDAAASGALQGMHMALAVGAMLLAFVALIAMLNGVIGWTGGLFGQGDLTFESILGMLFRPLAWLIGVPWDEAARAGSFIGQKLVVNEFVAYFDFVEHRGELTERTQAIVTFALCGFANFSSIAILLGGLGQIAPDRRDDVARFGLRALLAATLANLMSAALAGLFLGL